MALFKQKLDFDKFSYFALSQIYNTYESEKEAIIDKAQWENANKLTRNERDALWGDFLFFIPIGLGAYARKYFNGKYETHDIFARITEAYVHFLRKDKQCDEQQVKLFFDGMLDYLEKFEAMTIKEDDDNTIDDLISNVGVAFTNIYSKDDRTPEQIMNQISTKSSDKMFVALKLAKSYLIRGGILDKLYKNFSICW